MSSIRFVSQLLMQSPFMKSLFVSLAALALLLFPVALRAQDAPPPPPPDQGAPPPPDQGAPPDAGDQGASFQTFYDQLGNDGTWIQTDDYGYVFQPNVQDPQWAPYSDGHWVYTDEGWTWVSDEPWGWATYHYGRWANIDGLGWVWVPGYRWAPAWVSWRYGGGYAGWAPLPPDTLADVDYGDGDFHFGADVDVSFGIGAGCYNFVPVGYLGAPNARSYIVNRYRNYGIINHTSNITNFNVNRNGGAGRAGFGGVAAGGPPIAAVNANAHYRVPTVQLAASNTLSLYAPRVNAATAHQGQPATVARTITHPTFNKGTSISHPLAVTATVKPPAPSATQIKAAKTAQSQAPATAHLAHASAAANTGGSVHTTTPTFHPEAAETGEPANHPASNFHPEAAETGAPVRESTTPAVHHEETAPSAPAFHPEASAPVEHHEESAPAFHPEASAPVEHHEESAPAFHPQAAPVEHHEESAPSAPAFHPQSAPAPQPHPAPAPAPHPAPVPAPAAKPSGGGGPGKDPNHP
jgi:hypothetical protein